MTAFADYLDLRTAVLEDVGRPDLADVFDRLTRLAEARFNRELRMVDQITDTTVTFASGEAALPSDYAAAIGLYDGMGREYIMQPSQPVKVQGQTGYFSIEGSSMIAPNLAGDLVFQYYAKIPTLTDGMTTSNWLLQKYPALYLYGVGFEAAKHIRDAELAASTKGLFDMELADARGDDRGARYSRARVRVQGVTP
jgi:hypothetical protein